MTALDRTLEQTDWPLLSRQKLTLLKLMSTEDATAWADEHLQGLLNWIDAVQDAAEKDGFPVVFLSK